MQHTWPEAQVASAHASVDASRPPSARQAAPAHAVPGAEHVPRPSQSMQHTWPAAHRVSAHVIPPPPSIPEGRSVPEQPTASSRLAAAMERRSRAA
jgi:hypothetical protein